MQTWAQGLTMFRVTRHSLMRNWKPIPLHLKHRSVQKMSSACQKPPGRANTAKNQTVLPQQSSGAPPSKPSAPLKNVSLEASRRASRTRPLQVLANTTALDSAPSVPKQRSKESGVHTLRSDFSQTQMQSLNRIQYATSNKRSTKSKGRTTHHLLTTKTTGSLAP